VPGLRRVGQKKSEGVNDSEDLEAAMKELEPVDMSIPTETPMNRKARRAHASVEKRVRRKVIPVFVHKTITVGCGFHGLGSGSRVDARTKRL
jgi:hypothetical protein